MLENVKQRKETKKEMRRPKKQRYYFSDIKVNWQLYLMFLLPLIYLLVFKYYPMYGAQIAFRDYVPAKGIWGSEWVGLKHFARFVNSPQFLNVTKNTLALSTYYLVLNTLLPIILAIGLTYIRHERFKKLVQMSTYLPNFLSTVIVVGMLSLIFNTQSGVVNSAMQALFGKKINFLGLSKYFRHMYVWSGVWQYTGWNSIIYIAALAGVDPQLHDAAVVDGADKWKRVYHVDIPSIVPTIAITLIMNMGSVLSVGFDKTFLMQNAGNLKYSEVLSTYEYKVGVGGGVANYSYSTAISLMSTVVTFILICVTNKISKAVSETGLW